MKNLLARFFCFQKKITQNYLFQRCIWDVPIGDRPWQQTYEETTAESIQQV